MQCHISDQSLQPNPYPRPSSPSRPLFLHVLSGTELFFIFSITILFIIFKKYFIHLSKSAERRLLTVELVLVVMLAVLLVELVDVAVSVLVLVRLELEDVTEVLELLDVVFEVLPRCWMIWMVPIESDIS